MNHKFDKICCSILSYEIHTMNHTRYDVQGNSTTKNNLNKSHNYDFNRHKQCLLNIGALESISSRLPVIQKFGKLSKKAFQFSIETIR